jgi:hypothetical protein
MANTNYRVRELIREIRTRWRRRAVLQGAALSIGVLAVWGSILLLLYRFVSLPPAVLIAGAVLGAVLVLVLIARFVLQPAFRTITDRQIALYVEEQVPDLEDRLNSAVEIDDPVAARRAHGVLVDRLIDDAAERARTIPLTTVVDRHKERILTAAGGAGLVLFLILAATSLDELRGSIGGADFAALVSSSQPYMTVDPGDAEIEQGASQDVIVTLRDESDRDVFLHFRTEDGTWRKEPMQAAIGEPAFLHEFFDVQEPLAYFVEHDQQRSDAFTISLYTFPSVVQIDQTHTYPAYTQLAPRIEEDTGDIHGLKGSTVTLEVSVNGSIEEAELVLDDDRRIALEPAEDGVFRGTMRLEEPGFYTIRLTDGEQKQNKFPEEYRITPVDDEKPYVTVVDPQRDVRANSVEEVLVAARAQDDFGIKDMRLRFAVNGGDEQSIPLQAADAAGEIDVDGEHLFFLEDFDLEPGDVVSYYVEAEDLFHERPSATDMYFIEVIPFDRDYSQASAGGMQGGGGAQSGIVLNQQQIIAATWKLYREREEMGEESYASSRRALIQAQENLRSNIEERISATAFSLELQRDENTRAIAEHLRSAVGAMGAAVDDLEADRLREAMDPEREALNHLLKADAMNKERQVALNSGGQGGGSASATEERMTELMDLELDISKDKYETLPEASAQQGGGGEMDEAFQKLRELSRRQQNLANESRRDLEGEDQKRLVERLQRDQDDLRRQAESLSASMRRMARQDERLGENVDEQLDRVARNMQEAERALREGDVERARTSQQQAVNDLERLSEDMRMAGNDDRRQTLEEMDQNFERMRDQERQLARDLEQTAEQARSGRVDRDRLERLAEQRRAVRDGLERLDRQAENLAGRNADQPDLATAARNLRQDLRREALDEQMEDSEQALERGWLDHALRREEGIQESLDRMEESMRAFEGHLPVTDEERLARSLDELREMERDLRALQEQSGQDSPSAEGGEQAAGQNADGRQAGADALGRQDQAEAEDRQGQGDAAGQGREARADAAGRQARIDRARERLERMREDLGGTPGAQALDQLSRGLARADHQGVSLEGESARAFFNSEVFAPLSQLEEVLLSALDQIAMEKKLYGSRSGDVPSEYRALVEKYYESLSKSGGE